MNILITSFSFPSLVSKDFDGKFVLAEAIAYAENGANVKVLTPMYEGAAKSEILPPGIEVIRFNYFWPVSMQRLKKAGKPIYDSKSFLAFLQIPFILFFFSVHILLMSKWASLIHAQWTVTALLALPCKLFFSTRLIMTARGSDLRLLPKWLNRYIHRSVDGVIDCFGPQPEMKKYQAMFPAQYLKLPLIVDYKGSQEMPVDMAEVLGDSNKFIILCVGRYVELKLKRNSLFMDLIEAASLLNGKLDFHVFYIGGGEEPIIDRMTDLIYRLNVADNITMLGSKDNVDQYLNWVDLGLGGNALNAVSQEYIIAGIPQIMAAADKNIEALWKNGRNVILVKQQSPNELASVIAEMAKSRKDLSSIKINAQKDMAAYVSTTGSGGKLYLDTFAKIIKESN